MKKLMYIALAALAALTACTKVEMEDYTPSRKVTFQAAAYVHQTKSSSSVMSQFTSFTSKAYLHAEGYAQAQDFFGANGEIIRAYDNNDQVTTTIGQEKYWAPAHDYYWPKSGESSINFIAWYDKKGTIPNKASEDTLSWVNYTVAQDDRLVYADEVWNYNQNTVNGSQYAADPITSGVPMLFHHALAQLQVNAKMTNASNGAIRKTVTISNFVLSDVYTRGTLTLTNSNPGTVRTKEWTVEGGSWTGLSVAQNLTANSATLSTEERDLLTLRSILPQDVTQDMFISFDCAISTYYGNNENAFSVEEISFSKKLIQLVPEIEQWAMGHKIIYTLVFDASTDLIVISPTLQDWDNNIGGGGVTLE